MLTLIPVAVFVVILSYVWVLVISSTVFDYVPLGIYRIFIISIIVSILITQPLKRLKLLPSIEPGLILSLCLVMLMTITSFFTQGDVSSGLYKTVLFAFGNVLMYISASLLFRDKRAFPLFCYLYTALSICFAAYYWYLYTTGKGVITNRFLISDTMPNPIAIARFFGVAFILSVYLFLKGKSVHRYIWMFCIVATLSSAALTGSKGPTLAAVLCGGILALIVSKDRLSRFSFARIILQGYIAIGLVAVLGITTFLLVPEFVLERFTGESYRTRMEIWPPTIALIMHDPLGIGTNAYATVFKGLATYPHNIFLEFMVENGWLAGFMFLGFVVVFIKRGFFAQFDESRNNGLEVATCLFAFSLMCAFVSASITGNDEVWIFSGMMTGILLQRAHKGS